MILRNKIARNKMQDHGDKVKAASKTYSLIGLFATCTLILLIFNYSTCRYSFQDVSIPPEVKTFRVNYLENKARYINTQLSPQLTDQLKTKILTSTRLHETNDDSTQFDISGYVSDYNVTTSGVSGNTASTNRLSVTFHLIFKDNYEPAKSAESDVTYTKDFNSNLSLDDVGAQYTSDMVTYLATQIFNKIFSNW